MSQSPDTQQEVGLHAIMFKVRRNGPYFDGDVLVTRLKHALLYFDQAAANELETHIVDIEYGDVAVKASRESWMMLREFDAFLDLCTWPSEEAYLEARKCFDEDPFGTATAYMLEFFRWHYETEKQAVDFDPSFSGRYRPPVTEASKRSWANAG